MPEIAGIGILAAFLAGTVSFLSPCVLPLVPGYLSYVAGRSVADLAARQDLRARLAILQLSLGFVLGFSVVFIALGASASALGSLLRPILYEANYVAGAIIVLFGLQMTGLFRFRWMDREMRFSARVAAGHPLGAFVLGMAFAFGWTPCIGPILGSILTLSATTPGITEGAVLLSIYSMGLAVPFLLVAAFTDRFIKRAKVIRRYGRPLQASAGGVLILVGIGMATGYLTYAGTWLLNTLPVFQALLI